MSCSEAERISIWLTPDREEHLTKKELAAALGISYIAFYNRVVQYYGPDCDLTYYPGRLPKSCYKRPVRRPPPVRPQRKPSAVDVDPFIARLFILRFIKRTREDYRKNRSQPCRTFLLNIDGMLYWYLELMFTEDKIEEYIRKQADFVYEVDNQAASKRREKTSSLQ